MQNHSIRMVYKSGNGFYTGKVFEGNFYKNFKLNTSVLWSNQEFGINVEVFDYLKENEIKNIIYVDTASKNSAYKLSLEDFDESKVEKEFRYGKQYFVSVEKFEKIEAPKIPYIEPTIEVKEQ